MPLDFCIFFLRIYARPPVISVKITMSLEMSLPVLVGWFKCQRFSWYGNPPGLNVLWKVASEKKYEMIRKSQCKFQKSLFLNTTKLKDEESRLNFYVLVHVSIKMTSVNWSSFCQAEMLFPSVFVTSLCSANWHQTSGQPPQFSGTSVVVSRVALELRFVGILGRFLVLVPKSAVSAELWRHLL